MLRNLISLVIFLLLPGVLLATETQILFDGTNTDQWEFAKDAWFIDSDGSLSCRMEEVKARGGPIIAIASHDDPQVDKIADDVIRIPQVPEFLQPIVTIVPLQLLSYHIALLRGCDVDKPRNLAKSVTVE